MRNLLILAGLSIAIAAGGVQLRATLKASEAHRWTPSEFVGKQVIQLYVREGWCLEHIAKKFGTIYWVVRSFLRYNGVRIRSTGEARRLRLAA